VMRIACGCTTLAFVLGSAFLSADHETVGASDDLSQDLEQFFEMRGLTISLSAVPLTSR
jgi:hypothetical protein